MRVGLEGRSLLLSDPSGITGVYRYCRSLVEGLAQLDEIESLRLLFPLFRDLNRFTWPAFSSAKVTRRIWRMPDPLIHSLAHKRNWIGTERLLGPHEVYHTPHLYYGPRPRQGNWAVTIHDLILWENPEYGTPQAVMRHRRLLPFYAGNADLIFTDSEYSRQKIMEHLDVDQDRLKVAYLPVEGFYPIAEPDREMLAQKLGIDGPYVLYLGHLLPHKNVSALIEAFALLPAQLRNNLKLVVVGGPLEYQPPLQNLALQRGMIDRFILPGRIEPLETSDLLLHLINGASLFCYPSLAEGFGYPPLEAMACQVPVVCSDRSCLPEVVGEGALLADPTDFDAWSQAMQKVLEDAEFAGNLAKKGLAQAQEYNRKRFIEAIFQGYKQLSA